MLRALALVVAGACAAWPHVLMAQAPASTDARGAYAARGVLEERAVIAERAAAAAASDEEREHHRAEAWLIRHRLSEGDFLVGDRIVITVAGEPTLSDTFTVRAGPELQLANLPPLSLHGVLRSEVETHVTTGLSRYLRQPTVTVVPLLRVAVLGQVGSPGFYHVPADMLLSDVLMIAGGPAGDADLKRSVIRRGDDALYTPRNFSVALADGISLDVLGLQSGDVVMLEERRRRNWGSIFQIVTVVSGLLAIAIRLGA